AREILGPEATIGVSTHTLEELQVAVTLPVNYVAFGPIFSTNTKSDTEPVVGLELLRQARAIAGNTPLVAIGGITASNIRSVLDTGCDSAAVISALASESGDIGANLQQLQTKLA
ncbi:MAG: thiamine phosphate synthase, partial [Blastocatellia bacterium]|nr:thiamine phosphate synthase [Blastocatellia bacterium]